MLSGTLGGMLPHTPPRMPMWNIQHWSRQLSTRTVSARQDRIRFRPPRLRKPSVAVRAIKSRLLVNVPSKKAVPFLQPVYMALTSPLKQKKNEPSPSDHVVALDPSVFSHPLRRDILHLCVVHYRDSLRQGTASTKTRGDVKGSGRKIMQQKGTGKARVGDAQSPIRRGGGVAFGPKPRDFSTKLPRKVIQMGMRVALSTKVREQSLGVMSSLDWPCGKTKHLSHRVKDLGLGRTLFITGEPEIPAGLARASRNLPDVQISTPSETTLYDILKWPRLVLDVKAVEFYERTLSKLALTSSKP